MNRIIHGDCLEELKTLPSKSVDLVLTDPPYGDNAGYGRRYRTIQNNSNPLVGLLALEECYRVLDDNRVALFFLGPRHLPIVDIFVRTYTPFAVKEWLVWDKMIIGMGRGYRKRFEMLLALEKGKPHYNSNGFSNVLRFKRTATKEHPHKKPTDLLCSLIEHTTIAGDVVLDPFLGSGSTALAAVQCGRKYIGIECDKRYAGIAATTLSRTRKR